jgi:hypothetical protein
VRAPGLSDVSTTPSKSSSVGLNINSIGGTPSSDIKVALTKLPDLSDMGVELLSDGIISPEWCKGFY